MDEVQVAVPFVPHMFIICEDILVQYTSYQDCGELSLIPRRIVWYQAARRRKMRHKRRARGAAQTFDYRPTRVLRNGRY
eukprot:1944147-Rhodomonas_salina.1